MADRNTPSTLNGRTEYFLRWIVGELHVSATTRDVIKAVRDRLTDPLSFAHRDIRHAAYRFAIDEHARNFVLYAAVQSGRF